MIENTVSQVTVEVTETTTYSFPDYPNAKCSAHGDPLCTRCARNPSTCAPDDDGDERHGSGCGVYSSTGMHWDTCPNRIR